MRIAIYSRKSKETDTGDSIQNQIKMCKEYFNRQYDNCIFEVFEDEGFSGGNTNRPSFKRMMQLAKHKQFDIISCYKIDRISRNTLDFLTIFEELKEYDIQLVSVTEGFDPSTPSGKMMMSMISSMAEMERMNIAQRVKDNMLELGKMGRWSGGTCPTGYRSITINNGKKETYLELIQSETEKLQTIFKLVADGYSSRAVGKKFNVSNKTISNIIINPTYCPATEKAANYLKSIGYAVYGELNGLGFLSYNRRPKKNGKKTWKPEGLMFVATSKHETIITDDMWIKANEMMKSKGLEPRPRISKYSFLSQLVVCKCGSNMSLETKKRSNGSKILYFRCSGKKEGKVDCDAKWLRVEDVEKKTISALKKMSYDETVLLDYLNLNKKIDYDGEIKKIKKDINKKSNEINKLTERLILVEGPAINIITDKINKISNDMKKLNEELFNIERDKIMNSKEIDIKTIQKRLRAILINFNKLDITEQQLEIRQIIDYVKYDGVSGTRLKLK